MSISVAILFVALILALLAAIRVPSGPVDFGWLSVFFFFLYLLLPKLGGLS